MATSGGMASQKILSSGQVELNKIAWHSLSKEEVLQTLQSRTDGLTEREVKKRHSIYGYNVIIEEKKETRKYWEKEFLDEVKVWKKQMKNLLS